MEGVWYASTGDSVTFSDGEDAERYLKEVLTAAADLSTDSPTLVAAVKDWPSRYHLSPERANLLRSLGIERSARVLELGCGCGAITRYLGESAGWVTAVEGNPVRARLARLRCRDLDNVEVVACNFEDLRFDTRFDIVTLIGVLEYAALFWKQGGDPFEGLLRLAWQNLSDDGTLILAIENKLGIKYLSGCTEDHLSRLFVGIEGYPDRQGARTFGRNELMELLAHCGFSISALMLPFPDYKIPTTLINARYTSAAECRQFNLIDWCRLPFLDYSREERDYLFSDHLALEAAAANGMLREFSNSFLVVAAKRPTGSLAPIHLADWVARKFNVLRRPPYRTVTTLQLENGIPVITKHGAGSAEASDRSPVKLVAQPRSSFIACGISLSLEMLRALRRGSGADEEFAALVRRWVAYLKEHLISGSDCLPPRFLDCTPDNLIIAGKGLLRYIDDEWEWWEPVSMDWVLFRGLLGFWLSYRRWIERSLMRGPYRFSDFLDRALAPAGAAVRREKLQDLADLEAKFQYAVTISPRVNFEGILRDTYREKLSLHHVDALVSELQQAGQYIDRCHSTIEEKDSVIAAIAAERTELQAQIAALRSDLDRSTQECQLVRADAEKARKQLSLQIQKTRELSALAARLRAAADVESAFTAAAGAAAGGAVDIIIPVFNAYDETRACLDSVLRHTDARHSVVVIDDASTDARVPSYLKEQARRHPRLRLVVNDSNRGFIRTVNAALAESQRDVIVLNCDTIVTAGWAEKMIAAASSAPGVGMVCPLSNNATILSVPNMNENNKLPIGFSVDDFGRLVQQVSLRRYPEIPTAVGFCMYLSRKCLNDVGLLDEAFGMGYGEENDLAQRARARGYKIIVADDTFVFHSGSTSFKTLSGDLDQRKAANEILLGQRWPEYHGTIFSFCVVNPLREVQQRIIDGLSRRSAGDKPHVLQVLHSYVAKAGVELHTRQLAVGLKDFFRTTVFFPDAAVVDSEAKTFTSSDGVYEMRYAARNLASDVRFEGLAASTSSPIVESNFERILRNSDARIVHFQHLLTYGTLRLPAIAKDLGASVVISLHDYFYLCPVYNLVKPDKTGMCGNIGPDMGNSDCRRCFSEKLSSEGSIGGGSTYAFHAGYVSKRRQAAAEALAAADVVIAPSRYVQEKHARAFGREIASKIVVLSHGVVVPERYPAPKSRKQLHVTFLGNATKVKGFEVFGEAALRLRGQPIVMQAFGGIEKGMDERYRRDVRFRGPYGPDDLFQIMEQSDVVVIPSLWEETFCLTMSEALAHGIPVLASDIGALRERVIEGKNGFLFPPGDVNGLVEIIRSLRASPQLLRDMRAYCCSHPPKRIDEMIEQYRQLYDDLASGRGVQVSLN